MSDDELSLATFDDTARTIAVLWNRLPSAFRTSVGHNSRDLYEALCMLAEQAVVVKPAEPPQEYPAEMRVKDLENALKAYHRRLEALHHARKAWGGTMSEDADRHACNIITVAQAFEKYLTDGTVHEVPDAPQEGDTEPALPEGSAYQPLADMVRNVMHTPKVLAAALAWVDRAHLHNPSGRENWRRWADDHDVALINAVLAYRGLPPLERKTP